MEHGYDRYRFQSARGMLPRGTSKFISKYAGFPTALELLDKFHVESWNPGKLIDQSLLVDKASAPTETANGIEWRQTQFTASTVTFVDTDFPPHMRIATGAASVNGQQMQACRGLVDNATAFPMVGTTNARTLYNMANAHELFFSVTVRFSDANNADTTLSNALWFFGFAPPNVSLLTGALDHVGLAKLNGSTDVYLGGNRAVSSMPWADANKVKVADISSVGFNVVNKWITFSFIVTDMDPANQRAVAHAFLDMQRRPTGAERHSPTYLGSCNLAVGNGVSTAAMCPSIAFQTSNATAKNLDIARIVTAASYKLAA